MATFFTELPSTNEYVKEMAKKGAADRLCAVAARQSRGHGQFERVFESPEGGLYLSFLGRITDFPDDISTITLRVGRLMQDFVRDFAGVGAVIKPPNDLIAEGKKLCGILCESFVRSGTLNLIIGIGLNINTQPEDFSDELRADAASLKMLTGREFDIAGAALEIEDRLNKLIDSYK